MDKLLTTLPAEFKHFQMALGGALAAPLDTWLAIVGCTLLGLTGLSLLDTLARYIDFTTHGEELNLKLGDTELTDAIYLNSQTIDDLGLRGYDRIVIRGVPSKTTRSRSQVVNCTNAE